MFSPETLRAMALAVVVIIAMGAGWGVQAYAAWKERKAVRKRK